MQLKIKLDIREGMKQIQKVAKQLERANSSRAEYGYFGGRIHKTEKNRGDFTEATLMQILETGSITANIPERPVFKLTGESVKDSSKSTILAKPIKEYLENTVAGKDTLNKTLEDLGELMMKATQANFGADNGVDLDDNAKFTQQVKGRNDPLVDTGTLRDSMKVRVTKGGS